MSNLNRTLVLSCVLSCINSVHTLHSTLTPTYKSLIIILDSNQEETVDKSLYQDSQAFERPEGIGALTYTLLTALEEKAAPIITNTSLIANIVHHAKIYTDFSLDTISSLTEKYRVFTRFSTSDSITIFRSHCVYSARCFKLVNKKLYKLLSTNTQAAALHPILKTLAQDPLFSIDNAPATFKKLFTPTTTSHKNTHILYYHELVSYVLCAYAAANLQQWVIKKINNQFCLLIPAKFYAQQTHKKSLEQVRKKKYTLLEHLLNLQVDHMPNLELAHLHTPSTNTTNTIENHTLTHYLTPLFVPGSARWIIYLIGHGTPTNIAGFKHHEFTQFLQALNSLNSVHTLCYNSCYAGGMCLITPYYTHSQRPLRLNFSVLATALEQTPLQQAIPSLTLPPYSATIHKSTITIAGITPEAIDREKKCLRLITQLNFKQFFKILSIPLSHCTEQIYTQAVACISPNSVTHEHNFIDKQRLAYIASLRKPYNTYFTLLLPHQSYCTLDKLFFARSLKAQKQAFAQAQILVFAAPDITCPVYFYKNYRPSLNTTQVNTFCITRDYAHYNLKALHAPEYTLQEILTALYPFEEHAQPPGFTIKTLTYRKNATKNATICTVHNVTITHQTHTAKQQNKKRTLYITYTHHNSKKTELISIKCTL